jgi:hypothetical protein
MTPRVLRILLTAGSIFGVLCAFPAYSSCAATPGGCFCHPAHGLALGTVESTNEVGAALRVERVFGSPLPFSPGNLYEVPVYERTVDEKLLVYYWSNDAGTHFWHTKVASVSHDGGVRCDDSARSLTVENAVRVALSDDCRDELDDLGIEIPECNDTGYACTNAGAAAPLVVLSLIPIVVWASRRRRTTH